MATIPSTTFKQWKNGEVVNALDYMQELEILRTAINSNGTDLASLKGLAEGAIRRLPSGNSFPGDSIVGEVFYREDTGYVYYLDTDLNWQAIQSVVNFNAHAFNKENPHEVSAVQLGVYTKEEAAAAFSVKSGAGTKGEGRYVKFPDGTMICYVLREFDGQGVSFFNNGSTGTSTPEEFIDGNFTVTVTAYNTNNTTSELGTSKTYGTPNGKTLYRWGVEFPQAVPTGAKVRVSIQLMGRWK